MKRFFLVAVIALCGIAAQAQNKIFEKYAKMEGVEYVCINKAMFSAGLSIATAGMAIIDSADVSQTDLSDFSKFNSMITIHAEGNKKAELDADIQKLSKDKNYEVLMESHSADGNDATFLYNEKVNPKELIIYNIRKEDCSVVIFLKNK